MSQASDVAKYFNAQTKTTSIATAIKAVRNEYRGPMPTRTDSYDWNKNRELRIFTFPDGSVLTTSGHGKNYEMQVS